MTIYTSPFLRCVQTAVALASKLKCKLRVATVFGEWMNPDYFDTSVPPTDNLSSITASSYNWIVREARSAVRYVDFVYDTRALGPPGSYGEAWEEMHDRAIAGVDATIASERSNVVIIVSHGGLCNSILGHLKRKPELRKIMPASWEAVQLQP